MALSIAVQPTAALNEDSAQPADLATIEQTPKPCAGGFNVQIAVDRDDARQRILELIPAGTEVGQGASKTLDDIGVTAAIETSGQYEAIRPRLRSMDRATQGVEIRKLGASPTSGSTASTP